MVTLKGESSSTIRLWLGWGHSSCPAISSWCTLMGVKETRGQQQQQRVLAALCSQILPNASWDAEQLCAPAAPALLTGLSV